MNKFKVLGGLAGIVIGILIAMITPPEGLTVEAMQGMGVIICAVVWLIFSVTDEYIIILLMCSCWVLFGIVPFGTAFGTFGQSSWWLLVGALGIGVAVSKSGLLKRLSLYVMKIFPATFKGQVLALLTSGVVISPMIPSSSAKAAIIAPISHGISQAMGYEDKSRGAGGLFGAFYIAFVAICPLFLSASFLSYMILGLLPTDVAAHFSWVNWFLAALPWGVLVLLICGWGILTFYKPEKDNKLPAGYVNEKLTELGAWSKHEKITLTVVLIALVFWMTEMLHGISATIIALCALGALLFFRIYERPDFRSGLGWDNIIFIGGIMNMGSVLSKLNVDKWIGVTLEPYMVPYMSNAYLFIPLLVITIYVIRVIIVSWAATITILILLLVPFATKADMSPWIIGLIIYVSVNTWVVFYQSSPFLTSFYAAGKGEMVTHKQMIKLSFIYMIASLLGLFVSIPYWKWLGLLA